MAIETSYSNLRENLASILDRVIDDQEVIIIRRRNSPDVAMLPASELAGLLETAHLLRSPANAKRLFSAYSKALKGQGKAMDPKALKELVGL